MYKIFLYKNYYKEREYQYRALQDGHHASGLLS